MIVEYHRAESLAAALTLIQRSDQLMLPLGGGIVLNTPQDQEFGVVDLQGLRLDGLHAAGRKLEAGATATLQDLLETEEIPQALAEVIRHETSRNLRNVGTLAGALVASSGRSPLAAGLLALDARMTVLPGDNSLDLGNMLLQRESRGGLNFLPGKLITSLRLPLNVELAYHYVARTPADLPILLLAAARWPSGRARVVLGGWGQAPRLALDANNAEGLLLAVKNAVQDAGDEWASAAYRLDVAQTFAGRIQQSLYSKT